MLYSGGGGGGGVFSRGCRVFLGKGDVACDGDGSDGSLLALGFLAGGLLASSKTVCTFN